MYLEHGEEEGVGSSALHHLRQLGQLDLVGGKAPGGQVRQPPLHRLQAALGLHQAAQPLLAVDLNTRREYLKIRRKSRCSVENYVQEENVNCQVLAKLEGSVPNLLTSSVRLDPQIGTYLYECFGSKETV